MLCVRDVAINQWMYLDRPSRQPEHHTAGTARDNKAGSFAPELVEHSHQMLCCEQLFIRIRFSDRMFCEVRLQCGAGIPFRNPVVLPHSLSLSTSLHKGTAGQEGQVQCSSFNSIFNTFVFLGKLGWSSFNAYLYHCDLCSS